MQSVLFCGAETQLIASIKQIDPTQPGLRDSSPGAFRFLLLLSYSAFILNASATIASLIMIDRLGDLQFRAYQAAKKRKSAPIRHPSLPLSEKSKDDPDDWLLEDYGAGKRWAWMKLHCECRNTCDHLSCPENDDRKLVLTMIWRRFRLAPRRELVYGDADLSLDLPL